MQPERNVYYFKRGFWPLIKNFRLRNTVFVVESDSDFLYLFVR